MSIDIFGRQSETKSSKTGRRGPPGSGFKITDDGQFDIDNKRLCNIADPENSSDAIPLRSAQNIIQHEVQSLNEGSLLMRQDIDIIIHGLEAKFDNYRKNQRIENENTIEVISKLEMKVKALEKKISDLTEQNLDLLKRLKAQKKLITLNSTQLTNAVNNKRSGGS